MVRAVAPSEAGIMSLFVVLRKTLFDKSEPFQLRNMIRRNRKLELLALSAAAVCEHRLSSDPHGRVHQKKTLKNRS